MMSCIRMVTRIVGVMMMMHNDDKNRSIGGWMDGRIDGWVSFIK